MTLERLWAGWRTSYMDEVTADGNQGLSALGGSVFTRILRAVDAGELTDESAYVVARTDGLETDLMYVPPPERPL